MTKNIHITEDPQSNNVICSGIRSYIDDSGIKISKLKLISGLSRNTIMKVINEHPVRRATAEQLLHAMIDANLIDSTQNELAKTSPDNIHQLWDAGTPEEAAATDPDALIPRLARQLKTLRDEYEALFEQAQFKKGNVEPEDLRVLRVRFGQVQVLHDELMALYELR